MATTAVKHTWTTHTILKPKKPQFKKDGTPVEWKVQINEMGNFRCSCPSYIFSKEKPKSCKHIARVEQEQLTPSVQQAKTHKAATVSPNYVQAVSIFGSMCAAATAKVRFNVQSQIGLEAGKIMIEALVKHLDVFVPPPVVSSTDDEHDGVRIITFDD